MNETRGRERTLILRLWSEGEAGAAVWRCSVEEPGSQDRRGFSDVAELLPFLEILTRDFSPSAAPPPCERKKEAPK